MQGRSILDNIYLFWETVAILQERKEDLAIMLDDFEKAYDRVDWSFLRGTMDVVGVGGEAILGFTPLQGGYDRESAREKGKMEMTPN